jgi:hypothetical protein
MAARWRLLSSSLWSSELLLLEDLETLIFPGRVGGLIVPVVARLLLLLLLVHRALQIRRRGGGGVAGLSHTAARLQRRQMRDGGVAGQAVGVTLHPRHGDLRT